MTFDEVVDRLGGLSNGMARCPAHDDGSPSLSVTEGEDGKVVMHCHAGCSVNDIVAAIGIAIKDLFPPPKAKSTNGRRIVTTYDYTDERGELLYQSVRYEPKDFRQRRPDGHGGWLWKMGDVRIVPYRLPQLLEAIGTGRRVFIAEGEKDVDAIAAAGEAATCGPMGAGKWSKVDHLGAVVYGGVPLRLTRALARIDVVVVADKDEAGYSHARDVAESLIDYPDPWKRPASVTVVEAAIGNDAADHLGAGRTTDDFTPIASTNPTIINGVTIPLADWLDALSPPKSDAQAHTTTPRTPGEPPAMASDLRILDKFKSAIKKFGVVGEDATACIIYLVVTSRLLDKPISVAVKGHSASGKSFTTESTLKFFPRSAYIEMTAMSEKALVYSTEKFSHRILVIYEAVALREGKEDDQTAYFVRSLLSEGRIEYPVVVRDKDGNHITKTIIKEGPTGLIVTTTKTRIHAENETRLLSLTTDDSRAQTRRVLAAIANEDDDTPDLKQWHALQAWLETAEHRVTIPYAKKLADLISPIAVRLRRDFGQLLALIRCHAILHQCSRDKDKAGRIVATFDDYDVVHGIIADIIAEGIGATIKPNIRETVEAVEAVGEEATAKNTANTGVMVSRLAALLKLDRSTVSRRIRVAADDGWIINLEDKRGRPGRWVIGDPMPDQVEILPDSETIDAHVPTPDDENPRS